MHVHMSFNQATAETQCMIISWVIYPHDVFLTQESCLVWGINVPSSAHSVLKFWGEGGLWHFFFEASQAGSAVLKVPLARGHLLGKGSEKGFEIFYLV